MTPKRQTLDSLGTRPRPRTYVDTYTVRRKVTIHDIAAPKVEIVPEAVSHAKDILHDLTPKLAPPTARVMDIVPMAKPTTPAPSTPKPTTQQVVVRPQTLRKESIALTPAQPATIKDMVNEIQTTVAPVKSSLVPIYDDKDSDSDGPSVLNRFKNAFTASKRVSVTSLASLLLLVGGVVALGSSYQANSKLDEQVKVLTEVASASTDNESLASDQEFPSEEKPTETVVSSYRPPADEPRYITVPRLKNGRTRVLKMGLDKEGAIQTPRSTWDTGWFDGSSKPGEVPGASLIVGHVSGLTSGGIFYNLYRMIEGDEIIVEMGDGTKYTYRVVAKEEVPLEGLDMNKYLVSKDIDKPGLTLMTCAGEYNPITQTYDKRQAIFAVRDI